MQSNNLIKWILLIACAIIWGFSFFLIKKGLISFSANEVALLRISVTAIFLSPLLLFKKFRKVKRNEWQWVVLVGLLGSGIPPFLFAKAQQTIDSSVAGILNSLTPLFTLFLGVLIFKVKSSLTQFIGIILGLIGAIYLSFLATGISGSINLSALFIVLATFCYALSVNIVKSKASQIHPITLTVNAFLIIGIPAFVLLQFTNFYSNASIPEARNSIVAIIALGVIGTAFATVLFYYLVSISSALFSSTVTYLIPIVAIILGALDNEIIQSQYFICLVLILAGVYLVSRKTKRSTKSN